MQTNSRNITLAQRGMADSRDAAARRLVLQRRLSDWLFGLSVLLGFAGAVAILTTGFYLLVAPALIYITSFWLHPDDGWRNGLIRLALPLWALAAPFAIGAGVALLPWLVRGRGGDGRPSWWERLSALPVPALAWAFACGCAATGGFWLLALRL